ncbi:MAG TPA: HAD family hydrolase [Syntrophomonadaceae bacterium]|nr:HAD family hydrolase [Syntrophomonadaceae bacterium]
MKLAIFDFDGTLLIKDTLPLLGQEWLQQGKSKLTFIKIWILCFPYLISYKLDLMEREKMKVKILAKFNALFKNMTREGIDQFFIKAYPAMANYFNPRVLEEILKAQHQGYHCVLLSGTYAQLLNVVAEELGFDTVIAADINYQDGKVDLKRPLAAIDGQTKLLLLKQVFAGENINWLLSRSYGDSYADIPVMQITGEPIAVNPDEGLRVYAREKGWRII